MAVPRGGAGRRGPAGLRAAGAGGKRGARGKESGAEEVLGRRGAGEHPRRPVDVILNQYTAPIETSSR